MQYLCNYQLHRLLGLPSTFQVNFDEQCIFLLDTNHTLHCDIIALDAIFADRDGRIKVIGGGGIEGLLISPKQLPYKYIEFLQNQGYLVSILNENSIQVWNLEGRCLVCSLEWESNITTFSVIHIYIHLLDFSLPIVK
uniref:uncharacterized protein LOC105350951 n=1 Tax=Fragaria vesca subsp. vesca TaxID=101020 RepID=UPI0005CAC62E|nr:PREDICTED: uncharacterized protein LOC105350951 [Fragaria vesca subsp. vesca]XP_011462323.1 PREDICTED: uncharacterized protein LOC105350951 [Fragaria vesca subsp. vesca]XP_011462324.1 PREDICTED: uncharacterized protein LOC105350951 [Fragaria vesca subsp. vesca]